MHQAKSPSLPRAPGTRVDCHPHMAATTLCDPPPPEPGKRGEEIKNWGQGPRAEGAPRSAGTHVKPRPHPGHTLGLTAGARPPSRTRAAQGTLGAHRHPLGDRGAGRTAREVGETRSSGCARSGRAGSWEARSWRWTLSRRGLLAELGPGWTPSGGSVLGSLVLGSRPVAPTLHPAPTRTADPALALTRRAGSGIRGASVCLSDQARSPAST